MTQVLDRPSGRSDAATAPGGRHRLAAKRTPEPSAEGRNSARWWILAVLGLAQLIVVLDATIVNIALPTAQRALGFSDENRQWIVTAYALGFGSLLLLGGRLSDLVGRKPMFIVGLIGFAAASAVGGAAEGFRILVAARGLQGVFGAMLAPAALSLLTVTFTEKGERAKAFGIFGALSGGGGALGLILGGTLTEYLSWRWCLFVNVPLAAIAVLGALLLLKKQSKPVNPPTLDLPGTVVIVAGLVSLVYGLASAGSNGWTSTVTLACIGVGLALIAVFVLIERDVTHPLLPLWIVADRTRGGSYVAIGIVGAGMFAIFLFLTYYLSAIKGFSPIQAGFGFIPMILGIMATATGFAGPVQRFGPRYAVLSGMLLASAGLVTFAHLGLDSSYVAHILPGLIVTGLGIGLIIAPSFAAATAGVRSEDAGVASAAVNTFQQIGGSIGTAVLSAFAATAASDFMVGRPPTPQNRALAAMNSYTTVFWWGAATFAAGAVICGLLIRSGPVEVDPDADPFLAH